MIEYKVTCDACEKVVVSEYPMPKGWCSAYASISPDFDSDAEKEEQHRHFCTSCVNKLAKIFPQLAED